MKRYGTGHRIWVTFPALHPKTCPVQWHRVGGGWPRVKAWLSLCYLIPVPRVNILPGLSLGSRWPLPLFIATLVCLLRGHVGSYGECDLLLKGKILWVEPCCVLAGHRHNLPLFPCHPLRGSLGSSQRSECGSVIAKLTATLLWSHILWHCGTAQPFLGISSPTPSILRIHYPWQIFPIFFWSPMKI